jgi:foldase protein PrsA
MKKVVERTRAFVLKRKRLSGVVLVVVLGALVYFYRSLFVVALVNGYPVTRVELIRELEAQAGAEAMDSVVTKRLVLQEAKKKMIKVTEEDIEAEVSVISDQLSASGQNLNEVLTLQGITREELDERIRFQLILTKLIDPVDVSDEEIGSYIEENKDFLAEDIDTEEGRESIRQQLVSQKQGESIQTLLEGLQEGAKINYFLEF